MPVITGNAALGAGMGVSGHDLTVTARRAYNLCPLSTRARSTGYARNANCNSKSHGAWAVIQRNCRITLVQYSSNEDI